MFQVLDRSISVFALFDSVGLSPKNQHFFEYCSKFGLRRGGVIPVKIFIREKIRNFYKIPLKYEIFYLILFSFQIKNIIFSQPDSRFRAFDWTLIKDSGAINSITEGYSSIYIGLLGGVKRFNKYSYSFNPPITTAQGLKENNINAVHFDKQKGILWIASKIFALLLPREGIGTL